MQAKSLCKKGKFKKVITQISSHQKKKYLTLKKMLLIFNFIRIMHMNKTVFVTTALYLLMVPVQGAGNTDEFPFAEGSLSNSLPHYQSFSDKTVYPDEAGREDVRTTRQTVLAFLIPPEQESIGHEDPCFCVLL